MILQHFTYAHQVHCPWGEATAHFQSGSGGVESIESTAIGVEVKVKKPVGSYTLVFTAGGYGFARADWPCSECGELFVSDIERVAHKRSHKPNHKGDGK